MDKTEAGLVGPVRTYRESAKVPSSLPKIIVFGSSGHAKVVLDIIEHGCKYSVLGLIDSFKQPGEIFFGYPILGDESALPSLVSSHGLAGCFIAVGDNWNRSVISAKIMELVPRLPFVSPIHPSCCIGRNVNIGHGTVFMAGAVVNSDSSVGNFCILNTNASLDHDCVMDDFSSLAPNATIGGNVYIGAFSAISLGANVIHRRTIGSHTVVGAGAAVLDNIPDFCVAYGVPAKFIRRRQKGEKYL